MYIHINLNYTKKRKKQIYIYELHKNIQIQKRFTSNIRLNIINFCLSGNVTIPYHITIVNYEKVPRLV